MAAVARAGATGSFSWVGSDGWSARALVSDGNERAVEGTISVQPQANPVRGFAEYFLNLTVENNPRNPWFVGNLFPYTLNVEHDKRSIFICYIDKIFKQLRIFLFLSEFWEDQFRCRYPGGALTPYNAQYSRVCSGRERLSPDNTVFEAQLQFVTDAVLAFAYAIRSHLVRTSLTQSHKIN